MTRLLNVAVWCFSIVHIRGLRIPRSQSAVVYGRPQMIANKDYCPRGTIRRTGKVDGPSANQHILIAARTLRMKDVSFVRYGIVVAFESDRLDLLARAALAGLSFGRSCVDPASVNCVTARLRNFGNE